MLSETKALELGQLHRHELNYMRRAGLLSTKFPKTIPGRSRILTDDNVREIAFLGAFIRAGVPSSQAAAFVASFVHDLKHGLKPKNWIAFPCGDARRALSFDTPNMARVRSDFPNEVVITMIDVGEIIRRVDSALAEELDRLLAERERA